MKLQAVLIKTFFLSIYGMVVGPSLYAQAQDQIPGEFVAIAQKGVSEKQLNVSLQSQKFVAKRIAGSTRLYLIKSTNAKTKGLSSVAPQSSLIEKVEGNFLLPIEHKLNLPLPPLPDTMANADQLIPNDSEFSKCWALLNTQGGYDIGATKAWRLRTETAPDMIIAVIDSGVDLNHPDLKENLWVNTDEIPGNKIDDDKNGYIDDVYGADTHLGTGNPMDDVGHGTKVAGIIGAVGNNGIGTSGVIWKTKIMAIRAEDGTKRISYSGAIKGGYYAAANGAKVINGSWGTFTPSPTIKEMISDLDSRGIIFVGAVGNVDNNIDTQYLEYPAAFRLPNMIEVTAIDKNNKLTRMANYGKKWVNLAAPGWLIATPALGGGTTADYGTSLAAPFVTAAVALVWSEFPELTHYEVRQKILSSVDVIPELADKVGTSGRLNLARAMERTEL